MRYNARKRIIIYISSEDVGEYGEPIEVLRESYKGTELVCPMTASIIKKEYGITTTNPKKVILSKPLLRLESGESYIVEIEGIRFRFIERVDFDKFNILLIDEV